MRYRGLEVILKSAGPEQPLKEYANPDASDDRFQCYVESISGQKFRIVVNVHQDFNWYHAIGLEISWQAGSGPCWRYYVSKRSHQMVPALTLSDVIYQEEGDTWLTGNLAFEEYQFDDNASHNAGNWKDADTKQGFIQVKVQRVSQKVDGDWKPYSVDGRVESTAPIKVVKDKGIGHRVGALAPRPCQEGSRGWTCTAIEGQHGQQVKHKFLYRPKHALRKLGICPPSPVITATEPVDLTELNDDDDDDGDKVAEFVDLTQSGNRTLQPKRERVDDDDDLEAELERAKQRQLEIEARLKRRAAAGSASPRVKREMSRA